MRKKPEKIYCSCKTTEGPVEDTCNQVSEVADDATDDPTINMDIGEGLENKHCTNLRKRSAVNVEILNDNNDYYYEFNVDLNNTNISLPSWPTKSGRTENEVRKYCLDAVLSTTAGKLCFEKFKNQISLNGSIEQCVEDIKVINKGHLYTINYMKKCMGRGSGIENISYGRVYEWNKREREG